MSSNYSYQMADGGPQEIVLGCIADANGIICMSSGVPRLSSVIANFLQYIDFESNSKNSYKGHERTFGYCIQKEVVNQVCFFSASTPDFPQRLSFEFLGALQNRFFSDPPKDLSYWNKNLPALIDEYNEKKTNVGEVNDKLIAVTQIMQDNLDALYMRGKSIQKIHSDANRANVATDNFVVSVENLRCSLCKSNLKVTICLICVAATIIFVILICAAILVYALLKYFGVV
mmetsp:Transcript_25753/g.43128  ORF Transcript_25753/g.43128 Transcript_25753/m.43128 type:complete len:230 (+) Transcript_25753:83-772(+)